MHFTCGESSVTSIGRVTYFVVKNVTHTHTDSVWQSFTRLNAVSEPDRIKELRVVCVCAFMRTVRFDRLSRSVSHLLSSIFSIRTFDVIAVQCQIVWTAFQVGNLTVWNRFFPFFSSFLLFPLFYLRFLDLFSFKFKLIVIFSSFFCFLFWTISISVNYN